MRDVFIIGIGQTPVGKGGEVRGRYLARQAIGDAAATAGIDKSRITALYVGNMMAGLLGRQKQLGALYADVAGMRGIEAMTIEAACGSGAAAARIGYAAISGGLHDVVAVCGVERMTHAERDQVTASLATAADWELEGCAGESFVSLNAKIMALYIETYGTPREAFAPFAIAAHKNALTNPNALLHKPLDLDGYMDSKMLVDPLRLMDAPPTCDGSAAVILASGDVALAAERGGMRAVRIRASAIGTDSLALQNRRDKLVLDGAKLSSERAYAQAGVGPGDLDIFELHDAYTVITALSLEAAGFASRGEGVFFGADGRCERDGELPISTFGGLKARGHPVGATGVYQLVETCLQLNGEAGENQVPDAALAMVQNIGGTGATVGTHILERTA